MREMKAAVMAAQLLRRLMDGEVLTSDAVVVAHKVKRAAAKRYLDALASAFPAIEVKPGKPWTYAYRTTGGTTTPNTVMALAMARAALPGLRGSELDMQLANLLEEHMERLAGQTPSVDLGRKFAPRNRMAHEGGAKADLVDVLADAIWHGIKITVTYQHFGPVGLDQCTLRPLSLVPTDEGLFCFAFVDDSGNDLHLKTYRLYKVARLSNAHRLKENFVYPPPDEYDPADLFRDCFGFFSAPRDSSPSLVKLAFAPHWAGFLHCEGVHISQTTPETCGNEWLAATLTVHITLDLVQWLRGLGDEVRVVEPELLVNWVRSRKGLKFLASDRASSDRR